MNNNNQSYVFIEVGTEALSCNLVTQGEDLVSPSCGVEDSKGMLLPNGKSARLHGPHSHLVQLQRVLLLFLLRVEPRQHGTSYGNQNITIKYTALKAGPHND